MPKQSRSKASSNKVPDDVLTVYNQILVVLVDAELPGLSMQQLEYEFAETFDFPLSQAAQKFNHASSLELIQAKGALFEERKDGDGNTWIFPRITQIELDDPELVDCGAMEDAEFESLLDPMDDAYVTFLLDQDPRKSVASDPYRILLLSKVRHKANEKQIDLAYQRVAAFCHPSGATRYVEIWKDAYAIAVNSYNTLVVSKFRRKYYLALLEQRRKGAESAAAAAQLEAQEKAKLLAEELRLEEQREKKRAARKAKEARRKLTESKRKRLRELAKERNFWAKSDSEKTDIEEELGRVCRDANNDELDAVFERLQEVHEFLSAWETLGECALKDFLKPAEQVACLVQSVSLIEDEEEAEGCEEGESEEGEEEEEEVEEEEECWYGDSDDYVFDHNYYTR